MRTQLQNTTRISLLRVSHFLYYKRPGEPLTIMFSLHHSEHHFSYYFSRLPNLHHLPYHSIQSNIHLQNVRINLRKLLLLGGSLILSIIRSLAPRAISVSKPSSFLSRLDIPSAPQSAKALRLKNSLRMNEFVRISTE